MQHYSSLNQANFTEPSPPRPWLDFLPTMNAYPWVDRTDQRRSWPARAAQALRREISQPLLGIIGGRRRSDPWLTPYPCRLPNGKMGRAAAVFTDGEWTLVCRTAK